MPQRLPVGRVHGHRGLGGELTVRVSEGEAARWADVKSVWLKPAGATAERFEVESERSYRDRWVLKLRGMDSATEAANWRGATVTIDAAAAPALGEFEYWRADLVGMLVVTTDREVGRVAGIQPTGGDDLLVVETDSGAELLIPMHREIVVDVDERTRRITIRPPDGLLELNDKDLKKEDPAAP